MEIWHQAMPSASPVVFQVRKFGWQECPNPIDHLDIDGHQKPWFHNDRISMRQGVCAVTKNVMTFLQQLSCQVLPWSLPQNLALVFLTSCANVKTHSNKEFWLSTMQHLGCPRCPSVLDFRDFHVFMFHPFHPFVCSIKKRQAVECAKRFIQGFSAPCANLACSKTQRIVNKQFIVTVLAGALDYVWFCFGS